MSFLDRAQCDRSVAHMFEEPQPLKSMHEAVWLQVADPVFTCWEDI